LAIWHTVIKGIIAIKYKLLKEWETTITFFVCSLGFALSLPLCTETGIFVTYFLDYSVGSGWWIMVLYFLQLVAVFIVRGAPYCGENIVTVLFSGQGRLSKVLAPLISFVWNVVMPVALAVLAVASFQNGNVRELYDWNPNRGYIFWPSWTREVGSLLQLLPILCVPFVAIVQSCRYLSTGPSDIFEVRDLD
jgi:solute carrier family 6 (neurotransmitter transporter)